MKTAKLKGYSDYIVYENGDVISHKRKKKKKLSRMNHSVGYDRYRMVHDNGRQDCLYVHRVVIEAFTGAIPEGLECNHKDGNKKNNSLTNLELITHKENIKHAFNNNLMRIGENHRFAKLRNIDVYIVRSFFNEIKKQGDHNISKKCKYIANIYNVSERCISDIYYNNSWKHIKIIDN